MIEKIVDGKVEKFFADVCLLEQPFIKEPQRTVGQLVTDAIAQLGENIVVRRFARFQLGETDRAIGLRRPVSPAPTADRARCQSAAREPALPQSAAEAQR